MIKFTSVKSIKKFGFEKINELYSSMDFGYMIVLKSSHKNEDGTITLNYNASINSTNKVVRIRVLVENDSTKLLLQSINSPFE